MLYQNQTDLPILVIGAGIAGLSCANTLKNAGQRVVVLEARDRLGGRIHTQCNQNDYFDLGASWIHGIKDNPIWDIVKNHQIPTFIFNYTHSNYLHANKQPFSDLEKQELLHYIDQIEQQLAEQSQCSALEAVNRCILNLNYQGTAFTASQLKDLLFAFFEYIAHDPFATELKHLASNYAQYEGYFEGDEVVFPQGYHQVIAALSKTLDIKTGCKIQHIHYDHRFGVQVIDDSNTVYRGSQVVVTVPLGVLKADHITFTPPLPLPTINAIQQMGFGSFNKVFFELEHPLPFMLQSSKDEISTFYWSGQAFFNVLDLSSIYQKPIYLMLFGGNHSDFIDHATDIEVWDFVLNSLQQQPSLQPKTLFITRWGADPYSYGSFSFPTYNHSDQYTQELTTSIANRVFFAGEHCSLQYAGTVHGAYISGRNTALNLLKILQV